MSSSEVFFTNSSRTTITIRVLCWFLSSAGFISSVASILVLTFWPWTGPQVPPDWKPINRRASLDSVDSSASTLVNSFDVLDEKLPKSKRVRRASIPFTRVNVIIPHRIHIARPFARCFSSSTKSVSASVRKSIGSSSSSPRKIITKAASFASFPRKSIDAARDIIRVKAI